MNLGPIQIGRFSVRFTSHAIPDIGPRVIVHLQGDGIEFHENITADELRGICQQGTIAADAAESLASKMRRRVGKAA